MKETSKSTESRKIPYTLATSMSASRKLSESGTVACASGTGCITFSLITVSLIGFGLCFIFFFVFWRRVKYQRALLQGDGVPAKYIVRYATVTKKGRGDLDDFVFKIRQPKDKSDVHEDACPICLDKKPKPKSWVIFECGHAICTTCFQGIVKDKKLHATCPFCRNYLSVPLKEDASRGDVPSQVPVPAAP